MINVRSFNQLFSIKTQISNTSFIIFTGHLSPVRFVQAKGRVQGGKPKCRIVSPSPVMGFGCNTEKFYANPSILVHFGCKKVYTNCTLLVMPCSVLAHHLILGASAPMPQANDAPDIHIMLYF